MACVEDFMNINLITTTLIEESGLIRENIISRRHIFFIVFVPLAAKGSQMFYQRCYCFIYLISLFNRANDLPKCETFFRDHGVQQAPGRITF